MDHCFYIILNDDFNEIELKLNLRFFILFLQKNCYFCIKFGQNYQKNDKKKKNPISFMQFL